MKTKIEWSRQFNGDWKGSDGWGALIIQHSRKTKRWYLLRAPFLGTYTVLSHHSSRKEAENAANNL